MFKQILGAVMFCFVLVLNLSSASSAVNADCTQRGCVVNLTSAGPIEARYADSMPTSAGSLSSQVGTGQGYISADAGYVIWSRINSNNVWILNVETQNLCWINIGGACGVGNAVIIGSDVYQPCGGAVVKIDTNCSGFLNIPVVANSDTYTIARDATTLYALSWVNADVAVITPPAETSTTFSIGRQPSDQLVSIVYADDGELYTNGASGVYNIPLPLNGTSTLFQALPVSSDVMSTNGTHLSLSSVGGNLAILVPLADPTSYLSKTCTVCISAAVSEDSWFGVNGSGDISAWDFSNNALAYSPIASDTQSIAYLAPTVAPPFCSNNLKEGTEVCDGTDLGGQTCSGLGYDTGTLACAGDCSAFDESACVNWVCGNSIIEGTEECDNTNMNGQTCISLGHDNGVLNCTGCTFDESGCIDWICGDGMVSSSLGEECDGINLAGQTCLSLGLGTGSLACTGGCMFNTSGCSTPPVCGNGVQEVGEQCDNGAANSNTAPDACRLDCMNHRCGDSVIDSGEMCDDGNTLAGDGCDGSCQIETNPNCGDGQIDDGEQCDNGAANSDTAPDACRTNCHLPSCGDGVVDTSEFCDGSNLNGLDCVAIGQGFTSGTLACSVACTFDVASCTTETCNPENVVTEMQGDIDTSRLTGIALERYNSNIANLTKGAAFSCVDLGGGEAGVKVEVEKGSYTNIRISDTGWDVTLHLFATADHARSAVLLIPVSHKADMFRYGGGHILIHDGGQVTLKYGEGEALGGATLGSVEYAEFLMLNPDTMLSGNWLMVFVSEGGWQYSDPNDLLNFCKLFAGINGYAVFDLDLLGLLSRFNKKTDSKPSCAGCSQASGAPDVGFVLVIFLGLVFWLLRRYLRQSVPVRVRIRKR